MGTNSILLESGTNELEVVEFQVNSVAADGSVTPNFYGVNVGKVREIIKTPPSFSSVPKAHPSIEGVINLRGRIIPVVNLPKWLGKYDDSMKLTRVIITEFNKLVTGFLVSTVARIHRVTWKDVEPAIGLINQAEQECVTGVIKFGQKILLLLDFERIVGEIDPSSRAAMRAPVSMDKRRGLYTVLIAEDSRYIRTLIYETLTRGGYRVKIAEDGLMAYRKLTAVADEAKKKGIPLERYLNLLISDVEMPEMDGLHLLKRVKEHSMLRHLPVIIFTSMANPENRRKWKSLGAEDYIGKPDVASLVHLVDKILLGKEQAESKE